MWQAYGPNMDTQKRSHRAGDLGLGSVLVGLLPATLMTTGAPDAYTVEAVFTCRPEKGEVVAICGSETGEYLAKAGYPAVRLSVADRRLVMENTSLEELRDGLADVIADRLVDISRVVREEREAAAIRFEEAAMREHTRIGAVAALAGAVRFTGSMS